MDSDKLLTRARIGALVLMVLVAAEMLRYSIRSFYRAWRFCFGEPGRWRRHWAVDDAAIIETGQRVLYFGIWVVIIFASVGAFVAGLMLLNRCRKGAFFDPATARAVARLGAALSLAMVLDQLFHAANLWLLTLGNEGGPMPWRFGYDPSDFKSLILGLILFLFGWVMQRAAEVDAENRGYV